MVGGTRAAPGEMEAALEAIDDGFTSHLATIRAYLRQPSVSATGEGIAAAADLTARSIEDAGGKARLIETPGHPVVLGHFEGAGPTLLRYGMYDVQPADEPGWQSPPFEAAIRDIEGAGRSIVARGAANSKGTLAASICTLGAMQQVGELPTGVTFLIDGEEEIGSTSLPEVVAAEREHLHADAGFDLDLHADRSGVPDVYLGTKGVLSVMLTCRGGDWGGPGRGALHSSLGPIVASPAWSLTRALAALVDADERPLISLSRPSIPPEDEPLLDALAREIDVEAWAEEVGTASFKFADARALIEALVYDPMINLDGLAGGAPQGSKTILPHDVRAALDLRLPYGTDLQAAGQAVEEAVARVAPEVEVDIYETCPPARTSVGTAVARAMIDSHADVGPAARVWPSSPWWAPYHLFERDLGIPFAHGGAGHASGAHSANEYATVDGLNLHMKQFAAFLHRFAAEPSR